MNELKSNEHLIYETDHCQLIQDDHSETFYVQLKGDAIAFKFCQLIALKRKLQAVDIIKLLASDSPDVELIHMPHCDRFFVFTVQEILELKALLEGGFTMLELNSMIHKTLVRPLA
ncbi:MAG: hypothetical protein AAFX87_16380 [Bacteroidota bacterium]